MAAYQQHAETGTVFALRVGTGGLTDGLVSNGPVNQFLSQSVVGYSESEVDLPTGTVRMYSENTAHTQSLQTFGAFGERITLTGGAGTIWHHPQS